jgi:hypothetical protein
MDGTNQTCLYFDDCRADGRHNAERVNETIDLINVQKIIINVYKRVYNDIFTKRL